MKSIFDNTKFGRFNLKSRIIRSGLWESENESQKNLTPEIFERYEKLAENNVGIIVTELISMYSHDRFSDYSHYINYPYFIKEFRKVTDITHEFDTPIFAQIGFINCNVNGKQMMEVNDLEIEDIRKIQTDYVVAAKKVAFAGFDGIQLNVGNNYYLSRVMNPFENQRDDQYGGNTFNRVRMVIEIIQLIKQTTDLHIHCKVNLYQDIDDSLEICKILSENGADSLQITKFLSPQYFRKGQSNENMLVDFADNVSKEVLIPVVLGGGWSDMDTIQELINTTDIEYLSMYRPFVKSQSFLTEWRKNKHGSSKCKTCNNCYWKKSSVCIIDSED
ncbi:NADH-dependent flavin oxidoreductase [Methanobrevibacter sp.]|uniref:oxidoreductase n=1 Tax=Methanobrevibacter sp. TaxID=66852 RepID=UPI0025CF3D33|nr:NADH-dependent flavin oxidoreductase [Methanobrevibacter sp.]MBQ6511263.1 NADH-dependent flavin oxidoreductase [Methanobrevibacter sp.]